jgi:hypothetical protein
MKYLIPYKDLKVIINNDLLIKAIFNKRQKEVKEMCDLLERLCGKFEIKLKDPK